MARFQRIQRTAGQDLHRKAAGGQPRPWHLPIQEQQRPGSSPALRGPGIPLPASALLRAQIRSAHLRDAGISAAPPVVYL
jgi:hypothetical protein